MVKRDRPLPDRPFSYIISGHNQSTLSPPRPGGGQESDLSSPDYQGDARAIEISATSH